MSGHYLVTGAAGFLGSHLTRLLAARGHRITAVDIAIHANAEAQIGRLAAMDGVDVVIADLGDPAAVEALPSVDGVYHLAALNGTQNFYSRPWSTLRHSVLPTITLLERYGADQPEFFFYAGSSEAYASTVTDFGWTVPTAEDVPLSIADPKQVRWSYGASKLHGEVACFAAQAETGLPVVVGRFHNAYGPDMGVHHVIPDFIERGRRGVYELFGSTQTRSFIYVDDAVDAVTVLAERAKGEVVNIGSPDEVTILDLAREIMDIAGWSGDIVEHAAPAGSVARRAPDTRKLESYVDVTQFVPLRDGLKRTLENYLAN